MIKKLLKFVFLSGLLISCTNKEDFVSVNSVNDGDIINMNITYHGTSYNVLCLEGQDGELCYLNPEFNEVYMSEISKNPNYAMFDAGNDSIIIYDSEEIMMRELGLEEVTLATSDECLTRASTSNALGDTLGYAVLWDDTRFRDRTTTLVSTTNYQEQFIPNLKAFNKFNDKTSSLKVWNLIPANGSTLLKNNVGNSNVWSPAGETYVPQKGTLVPNSRLCIVLRAYWDSDYNGKVLCCVVACGEEVHCHSSLHGLGWNDKISSTKIGLYRKTAFSANDN